MPDLTRISLKNISKKFYPDLKGNRALVKFLDLFSGPTAKRSLQVLDDISFQVSTGEIIGVIGRNGSGKSTLLRIIAEIYLPDSGTIKTNGKVLYVGGMGRVLIKKLDVRENIDNMGSVMGLSQKDIRSKINDILEFAGLNEFADTKVYQLSTGMTTRLAFSIAIHCVKHHNPDIVLLDEVLGSSGDIEFQGRAIQKVNELIKSGAAIVMVSHNLKLIQQYCARVLWLEKGKIVRQGNPEEIVAEYQSRFSKAIV